MEYSQSMKKSDEYDDLRRKSLRAATPNASLARVHPGSHDSSSENRNDHEGKTLRLDYCSGTRSCRETRFAPNTGSLRYLHVLGWTVWLIPLNIVPNDTVNRVMNTTTFDYGSFWLMVDPPQALKIVAALGLVLVAGGYLVILVRMAKCRRNVNVKQALDSRSQPDFLTKIENALEAAASEPSRNKLSAAIAKLAAALANEDSKEQN